MDFKCFLYVFSDLGTKIDENVVPGPIRDQVGIQTPKKSQKVSGFGLDLLSLGAIFRIFQLPLGWSFSVCFGNDSFSPPGWHLATQGARKGGKREAEVMKKEARRDLVEHAKSMAGIVREAYGEVPGRAQDALFSEHGADAFPEGSRERSKRIF